MAGAAALLLDHEQQRVAVAVVVRLAHELAVAADVSPLRHTSWRLRLQNTMRPSSSVMRSVSAFIHAIISTSPVLDVLDDRRHEAVGVERDGGELLGVASMRVIRSACDSSAQRYRPVLPLRCARRRRRGCRARAG